MGNAFTNFLSGAVSGAFANKGDLKDFQHANRVFVQNTYARAPKTGFLYFINFNINKNALQKTSWEQNGPRDVGILVKKADLPKFSIATETLNQYNRKTVIQKEIKYTPVNIEFHDDNSNITRDLWVNYYKYYYVDSNYGSSVKGKIKSGDLVAAYQNTKYGETEYAYGLNNNQKEPFFTSIDLYVLHQQRFSQFTLVNPLLTEWQHDSVESETGNKILTNKMTVAYEAVFYNEGKIKKGNSPTNFAAIYYDTQPSPLSISGKGVSSLFGAGGVIDGASAIFGSEGSLKEALTSGNPLDVLKVAIQGKNLAQNIGKLSKTGLKQEGYSIVTGVLGNIAATGNQPGGIKEAINSSITSNAGLTSAGKLGINIFAEKNSSGNNKTKTKPSEITGGGGGGI